MFPRLRQQLLARADLLVELATLGEYGLDEQGRPMTLDCAETVPPPRRPRVRGDRCDTAPARCDVTAATPIPRRWPA